MSENINERVRSIAAMRARKLLHWMRVRGEVITDDALKEIISKGVWKGASMRLADFLVNEVGIAHERAMDLTMEAIEKGYENADLY